jgi:hypothetical protein
MAQLSSADQTSEQTGLTLRFARGVVRMLVAMPAAATGRRMRRNARFRRLLRRPQVPTVVSRPERPDPVAVVVMALDRLGPASIRASLSGVGVRVTVPDERMASVFRAALTETQRRRVTDRLIEIVVEPA